MVNLHLMEQNWAEKMMEDGRCNIFDTEGTTHTLVLPTGHLQSAQAAVLASRSLAKSLVRWRNDVFGATGILDALDALDKADSINFRLEDQDHWFDQTKTKFILQMSGSVDVVDTNGKRYTITRARPLAENKVLAFRQWKVFFGRIVLRLMGEDVLKKYQVVADPTWSLYDVVPLPQPVGSQTPLDRFDWDYDADPSQDLETHLAKLRH